MLIAGLMITARANDMVLLFLGLELVSIPTYVLLYLGRRGSQAQEATAKYFLSEHSFFGFAAVRSELSLRSKRIDRAKQSCKDASRDDIHRHNDDQAGNAASHRGLGFRLTAVPFHFYAPDVYQGVGHANAGLLSTMPKVAGLLALIRVVAVNMPSLELQELGWKVLLAVSLLTMTLGNIVALWQKNLRRMFAYPSIAHGGYLLIGVTVGLFQSSLADTSCRSEWSGFLAILRWCLHIRHHRNLCGPFNIRWK